MMNALYTLTVKDSFSAAHQIDGYTGPCSRLHGHNYHVSIEVEANKLSELGWVMDFQILKDALKKTLVQLDHYNLNELDLFKGINPTAEVIARWIYQDFSEQISQLNVQTKAINLHETQRCSVRYEEKPA